MNVKELEGTAPLLHQDYYNDNTMDAHEGHEWRDVKAFLESQKDQLADGEIVLDASYNYFGVISVIEIGDLTMDVNLGNEKVLDIHEQPLDVSVTNDETILHIMDNYLRVEATWHSGRFLHQTLLTSNYLARRKEITTTSLRLFMEAAANTMVDTISMMESSEVCDTEEFFPALKGTSIGNICKKETLIVALKQQEKELMDAKTTLSKQVALRLTARRLLLETNALIEEGSIQAITKAQTLYHQLSNVFSQMNPAKEDDEEGHALNVRKLANSSHPIPKIKWYTFLEAKDHFITLADHLEFVCKAKERRDDILLLLEFSKVVFKMQPSVLVRNMFMLMVFRDEKVFHTNTLNDLTRSYVRHCPTLTATHKRMISTPGEFVDVDNWVHNIGICFIFSIQAFSMNAGRTPRRLKMLLNEWNSIVQKGAELDYIAHLENKKNQPKLNYTTPFASYVQDVVLALMHDYLTINHSLGLYDENEYPYIFFYLHYLNVSRWSARSSFSFLKTYEALAGTTDAPSKKKKKKKKNKSMLRLKHELMIHLNYQMTRAMSFFIYGLTSQKMLSERSMSYGSLEACYNSRMGQFKEVSVPGYMDVETYKDQTSKLLATPLDHLYVTADQHFTKGLNVIQRLLTQLKDTLLPIEQSMLEQYEKTLKFNQTVTTVARNQSKNPNGKAQFLVKFVKPTGIGGEYPLATLIKQD
mmetsp:Transcript_4498/g.6612  ORF Transcript_4498/g.6612 Transcript_4498/m.6612 type:complete len:698 (+) Transcript_4498:1621-3714(+)